jgi:hypothetical protein
VLVFQVDFACIMLSAGVYKLTAGYARNEGMELGLANPQWGYWWRAYASRPPGDALFRWMNHLAWATEIGAAMLMLIPPTRTIGAILIVLSFLFIATQIRLGFLCEMVIVAAFLFFEAGTPLDRWVTADTIVLPAATSASPASPIVTAALCAYLVLLPLAHAGLFYNFYARRALPPVLQRALDRYANALGIIIWRVFSADHTNFCIFIYRQPRAGGTRTLVSRFGLRHALRFAHVGESITLTSLFTTLKYYPSNNALFTSRLLRYARTLPCPSGSVLLFEYVSVGKGTRRFEFEPVAEFLVDLRAGTVNERCLSDRVSVRGAHAASPLHEGLRPGTYVALPS